MRAGASADVAAVAGMWPDRGVVDRPHRRSTRRCAARLAALLDDAPLLPTGAGHDAGILAAAGVPTAMLFVRNPTGVSHSPEEHAEDADCAAGVTALTAVLRELACAMTATYWAEHAWLRRARPPGSRVDVTVDGPTAGSPP